MQVSQLDLFRLLDQNRDGRLQLREVGPGAARGGVGVLQNGFCGQGACPAQPWPRRSACTAQGPSFPGEVGPCCLRRSRSTHRAVTACVATVPRCPAPVTGLDSWLPCWEPMELVVRGVAASRWPGPPLCTALIQLLREDLARWGVPGPTGCPWPSGFLTACLASQMPLGLSTSCHQQRDLRLVLCPHPCPPPEPSAPQRHWVAVLWGLHRGATSWGTMCFRSWPRLAWGVDAG